MTTTNLWRPLSTLLVLSSVGCTPDEVPGDPTGSPATHGPCRDTGADASDPGHLDTGEPADTADPLDTGDPVGPGDQDW